MLSIRSMRFLTITAAVTCLAGAGRLAAQAPNVLYNANGVFSSPQVNGTDEFKLAGEPFNITVTANAATPPTKYGAQWAEFTNLKATGTVHSGLVPTPFSFSTTMTNLELAVGNPMYDVCFIGAPIKVIGLTVNLLANIKMPPGTITKPLIHPFSAAVNLSPANTQVVYSAAGSNTTLTIASGTLNAQCQSGCAPTTSWVAQPGQQFLAGLPAFFSKPAELAGRDAAMAPLANVTAYITIGKRPPVRIHID
jgi:hypothetical protein